MGKDNITKWPGSCFNNEGDIWTCRICGLVASNRIGNSLRQSVRKFHTVARCAKGLWFVSEEAKAKAIENVEEVGLMFMEHFMTELSPVVPLVNGPSLIPPVSTRSRSRSPVNLRRERTEADEITLDFLGRRIAKYFDGNLYFGTVSARVRGPVVEVGPSNGTQLFQAVWKIVYDDGDTEQLNRGEIVAALRTYRLNIKDDPRKSRLPQSDVDTNIQVDVVEAHVVDGVLSEEPLWGTDTDFLDPKYNLLDLLTPTTTQNRLSYRVELVIDQASK